MSLLSKMFSLYMTECFSEQSRLYLGLGRDGLLPSIFAKVHPKCRTPIHSQIWVGIVAAVLGGLFNVHVLSIILSVGALVCCCPSFLVITLSQTIVSFTLKLVDN